MCSESDFLASLPMSQACVPCKSSPVAYNDVFAISPILSGTSFMCLLHTPLTLALWKWDSRQLSVGTFHFSLAVVLYAHISELQKHLRGLACMITCSATCSCALLLQAESALPAHGSRYCRLASCARHCRLRSWAFKCLSSDLCVVQLHPVRDGSARHCGRVCAALHRLIHILHFWPW